ncbi:MAG: phosphoglucosamine mutase, partial [Oscillospiraceae bacterium]
QVTQNVSATKGQKLAFYNNEAIKKEAAEVRTQLGDTGRLVLRVSGTEPVIRVMIEGKDIKSINVLAKGLAKIVEKELASITD